MTSANKSRNKSNEFFFFFCFDNDDAAATFSTPGKTGKSSIIEHFSSFFSLAEFLCVHNALLYWKYSLLVSQSSKTFLNCSFFFSSSASFGYVSNAVITIVSLFCQAVSSSFFCHFWGESFKHAHFVFFFRASKEKRMSF